MAYALFAQEKVAIVSNLNTTQLKSTQRSAELNELATDTLNLQQKESSIQIAESTQLAALYEQLAEDDGSGNVDTDKINMQIKALEAAFDAERSEIERDIYKASVKENIIDMDVKRLDTEITELKEQLEAVKTAEGDGIKNSTPQFNGVS